jgi:hypothetical protein
VSKPMQPGDPAYWMLTDDVTSTPVAYRAGCYICEDPEFAAMGLPLCRVCPWCEGHVAADDTVCDNCGRDERCAVCPTPMRCAPCKEPNVPGRGGPDGPPGQA